MWTKFTYNLNTFISEYSEGQQKTASNKAVSVHMQQSSATPFEPSSTF